MDCIPTEFYDSISRKMINFEIAPGMKNWDDSIQLSLAKENN